MPITSIVVRTTRNRFPLIARAAVARLEGAVRETAVAIDQDVKGGAHAAPIDTGNLRRSYHVSKSGALEYEVGSDPGVAEYAGFVENGTYKMAAQPHLRPATEAQAEPFAGRIRKAVQGL